MNNTVFYHCPICGNVIFAAGEAVISCCGIVLPPLDAETPGEHCPFPLKVEKLEDEYFVSIDHPMEKSHYISFMAAVFFTGDEAVFVFEEPLEGNERTRENATFLKR